MATRSIVHKRMSKAQLSEEEARRDEALSVAFGHSPEPQSVWNVFTRRPDDTTSSTCVAAAERWLPTVEAQQKKGEPIRVLLYDFPPKSGQPKINRRTFPDAVEWWLLHQLRRMVKMVRRIYEPGLEFTLVAEGDMFASLTDLSIHGALEYQKRLADLNDEVGAPVTIMSFEEFVRAAREDGEAKLPEFWRTYRWLYRNDPGVIPTEHHALYPAFRAAQKNPDPTTAMASALRGLHQYLAMREALVKLDAAQAICPGHIEIRLWSTDEEPCFWWLARSGERRPHYHGTPLLSRSGRRSVLPFERIPGGVKGIEVPDLMPEADKPFLYILP